VELGQLQAQPPLQWKPCWPVFCQKVIILMTLRMTMKITDDQVRNALADIVAIDHGNEEFIRQIRNGEQDDNWIVRIALAIRDKLEGGK
jgi:hypothetical protein